MPVVVEDGTGPYLVWMEDWEIGIERGGVGGTECEDKGMERSQEGQHGEIDLTLLT